MSLYRMNPQVILHHANEDRWLSFTEPVSVIQTNEISEVAGKLIEIETRVRQDNLHAAGFVSYEAAPAFDRALITFPPDDFPLIWFGLYKEPEVIRLRDPDIKNNRQNWRSTTTREEYNAVIRQIKNELREGNTYQVNYTFPLECNFEQDPWELFINLAKNQQSPYSAYMELDRFVIASISPELFFSLDGNHIYSMPMKGTRARGRYYAEDLKLKNDLQNALKDRAENTMIVDMIRNDFGRIAEYGTVKADDMYCIEKYPTVWQMVSGVSAKTNASIPEIFKALFPCASITGAPKVNTMKIINRLEKTQRRIYTGSIGFIAPNRKAQFNVAIRTILFDKNSKKAEYGVGGGIVWDSIHEKEYEECFVKSRALIMHMPEFRLLESILWNNEDGYFILDYHLQRMRQSAEYFNFKYYEHKIFKALSDLGGKLDDSSFKIRVLLSKNGGFEIQSIRLDLPEYNRPLKVRLAKDPVDSENIFLYHKTTNREIYDRERNKYSGYDEILLFNEKDEITEFTNANVVVKIEDRLYTPPVTCGLLSGTYRQYLLDRKQIIEKVIKLKDLEKSEEILLINSVRKIHKIENFSW
ncbi:MAG: aminodeoxychorismate synthase component I [Calditrichaceae bacterium]